MNEDAILAAAEKLRKAAAALRECEKRFGEANCMVRNAERDFSEAQERCREARCTLIEVVLGKPTLER